MFAACLLLLPATTRGEQDHALDRVPPIQSAALLQGGGDDKSVCHFGALGSSLSLHEAVSPALCNNPQTRQSWASIQVQTVFVATAQAYYALWSAQASLLAADEAERSAQQSYRAAQRKHETGVGTLNDKLQAETAHAQAIFNQVKAQGALKNAQGTLAIFMGLAANSAMTIDPEAGVQPSANFNRSIEELLDIAKRNNPTFLFEGFGRVRRVRAARAQAEVSQAAMENADFPVALEVWKNYQDVLTQTESLKTADAVLQSARQSYDGALVLG